MRQLVLALLLVSIAAVPARACPYVTNVSPGIHCLEEDLREGIVRSVTVGERDLSWTVQGDPRVRRERMRLAADEVSRLLYGSVGAGGPGGHPAYAFTLDRHAHPAPVPMPVAVGLTLAPLVIGFVLLAWLRRRSGMKVRLLTRQAERRENVGLIWTTLVVIGLIWTTLPKDRAATLAALDVGVDEGLVTDVTYRPDSVSWQVLGVGALTAPVPAPPELKRRIADKILHLRDPQSPRHTLHHVRIHTEAGAARWLSNGLPWLAALGFWCAWLRVIRRQSWW